MAVKKVCVKCGNPVELGYSGVSLNTDDTMCDNCAHIKRDKYGMIKPTNKLKVVFLLFVEWVENLWSLFADTQ
jgi:hypothetical protein